MEWMDAFATEYVTQTHPPLPTSPRRKENACVVVCILCGVGKSSRHERHREDRRQGAPSLFVCLLTYLSLPSAQLLLLLLLLLSPPTHPPTPLKTAKQFPPLPKTPTP